MRKSLSVLFVPLVAGFSFPAIAATSDVPISYAERGLPFPVSRKGATINITTGKISDIAISDKSCVVYSQIQNSIYVRALDPCLRFEGVGSPDRNPILRTWVDSKILEFRICSGCSGGKNITIVPDRSLPPIGKALKSDSILAVPKIPKTPKVIAIAPPPPQIDPTAMVQESPPTPIEQGQISPPFPLLKPIPQITEPPVEIPKLKQKKIKKRRTEAIVEPLVPKDEVKSIEPETPQDLLSPSQRAIADLNLDRKADQPSQAEKIEEEIKPVPTKKEIVRTIKKRAIVKFPPKVKSQKTFKLALNQSQAKALLKGLNIARLKKGEGHIAYRSRAWMTVQDAIYYLKAGNSLDLAIKKSRASKPLVEKLMELGGWVSV